jgi:hypothetical protein
MCIRDRFCVVRTGPDEWETRKIEIGATNDKTVTVLQAPTAERDATGSMAEEQMAWGLKVDEEVVLNPRQHLDLLKIPADLPQVKPESDGPVASRAPDDKSPLLERPASLGAEQRTVAGGDS